MPSAKRPVQAAILTLNAVPRASRSTRPPNRPGGGPLQGTRAIAEILFPNPASVRAEGRGRTEQMAGERSVRPVRDAGAMKAEAVARVAAKTVMTRIEAISVECWYRGATTRRFRWEVLAPLLDHPTVNFHSDLHTSASKSLCHGPHGSFRTDSAAGCWLAMDSCGMISLRTCHA